jgi:L-amino acid N-acyltransferase YncA
MGYPPLPRTHLEEPIMCPEVCRGGENTEPATGRLGAMTSVIVRSASAADAEAIARIYNYYILNTVITFEEEPVSAQAMGTRLAEVRELSLPWLVAEVDGAVVGYAYASKWKGRCSYRYSVEATIYLEHGHEGRGIGARLYAELLSILRARGMHVVIGGAALPNEASVALHEKLGFEHVATFRQVGFKHGRWIDVAYWQLVL